MNCINKLLRTMLKHLPARPHCEQAEPPNCANCAGCRASRARRLYVRPPWSWA